MDTNLRAYKTSRLYTLKRRRNHRRTLFFVTVAFVLLSVLILRQISSPRLSKNESDLSRTHSLQDLVIPGKRRLRAAAWHQQVIDTLRKDIKQNFSQKEAYNDVDDDDNVQTSPWPEP